jgi:UDP-N-acetylglucosamine--N-acetylmuramyl-(pentapeptide) pyrophosphoryl-undecaprenol N-acetylglucosamine transferase
LARKAEAPGSRYLFTGGGTGGHLYPALAVARELGRNPENRLLYVGVRGRAEDKVLGGERRDPRLPLVHAASTGFPGLRTWRLLPFLLTLLFGILQATGHLLRFRPHLIFATGGFASAPTVFAAAGLRRLGLVKSRILIHEQNVKPGLMNRQAARLADLVALTFAASSPHLPRRKTRLVGYPVRRDLMERPGRREARSDFELDPERRTLLVFGGSQGARCINRTLYALLPDLLRAGIQVIHGYGTAAGEYSAADHHEQALGLLRADAELAPLLDRQYRPLPYLHDMKMAYAAADLVLARAGAGAIFELVSCGLPSILVPKMGLPADHQVANARLIEKTGAARVALERPLPVAEGFEEEVDTPALRDLILELIRDDQALEEMSTRCADLSMAASLDAFVDLARRMAAREKIEPDQVPETADEDRMSRLERASDGALLDIVARGGLNEAERRYLIYRYGAALVSPAWARRNVGVKLAGALQDPGAVPLLLHLINDQRRAGLPARLLGESHYQNGFIRRNLATALGRIGVASPEVVQVLRRLLEDSYWEVRVESLKALAALSPRSHEPELVARALSFLKSRCFEQVTAAIQYWDERGVCDDWRGLILPLLNHNNIKVREKAVVALVHQVRAGRLPGDELEPILRDVLVTSTYFSPEFPIKTGLRELALAIDLSDKTQEGGGK